MDNWDDIRLFLAVARAGSLSAAAPVAKMDAATLSRRMARLERRLERALFLRSPQGAVLTAEGEALLDHARRAEEALRPGLDPAPKAGGLSGQIRIGAPDGCANFLLPQVCDRIQADNPALDLQILALPRVVNLSRREADMAVTVSPPETGRLTVQKITDYHLHLATSAENAPRVTSLEQLNDWPLVGYIPDMIFDRELDYLGNLGADSVQLASNSVSVQLQMLRQGRGVGIVHDFALPFAPELRRVLTREVSLTRAFYLVRHASDRQSHRFGQIARALAAGLKAEVARLEQQAA
ncbi:MAG: LysR family transcriptional regulator [Rhodobacterales bacterium]|nr:MAG: LysR family transcriptional regulator [Rhodobacterales bacterium]